MFWKGIQFGLQGIWISFLYIKLKRMFQDIFYLEEPMLFYALYLLNSSFTTRNLPKVTCDKACNGQLTLFFPIHLAKKIFEAPFFNINNRFSIFRSIWLGHAIPLTR